MRNNEDSIFMGMSFKWKVFLGILSGLTIMFVIMTITFSVNKSSVNEEIKGLEEEIEKIKTENKELLNDHNTKTAKLKDLRSKEAELNKQLMNVKEKVIKADEEVKQQEVEIGMLYKNDLNWLIGFVPSTIIGGLATHFALTEYKEVKKLKEYNKKLEDEVVKLNNSLIELNTKYLHYHSFFNNTYEGLIENMVIQSMNGTYELEEVFSANKKDSLIEFKKLQKVLEKLEYTTIVFITEDDWVIAAFLNKPWQNGMLVNDNTASLFSVTRRESARIKANNSQFAGLLNVEEKFLKFGLEDLIIYGNFTGTTNTNSAYKPSNLDIPYDKFFAGKSNFSFKEMYVYQHNWVDNDE